MTQLENILHIMVPSHLILPFQTPKQIHDGTTTRESVFFPRKKKNWQSFQEFQQKSLQLILTQEEKTLPLFSSLLQVGAGRAWASPGLAAVVVTPSFHIRRPCLVQPAEAGERGEGGEIAEQHDVVAQAQQTKPTRGRSS